MILKGFLCLLIFFQSILLITCSSPIAHHTLSSFNKICTTKITYIHYNLLCKKRSVNPEIANFLNSACLADNTADSYSIALIFLHIFEKRSHIKTLPNNLKALKKSILSKYKSFYDPSSYYLALSTCSRTDDEKIIEELQALLDFWFFSNDATLYPTSEQFDNLISCLKRNLFDKIPQLSQTNSDGEKVIPNDELLAYSYVYAVTLKSLLSESYFKKFSSITVSELDSITSKINKYFSRYSNMQMELPTLLPYGYYLTHVILYETDFTKNNFDFHSHTEIDFLSELNRFIDYIYSSKQYYLEDVFDLLSEIAFLYKFNNIPDKSDLLKEMISINHVADSCHTKVVNYIARNLS